MGIRALTVNGTLYNRGVLDFLSGDSNAFLDFENFGFFNSGLIRGHDFSIRNAQFSFNLDSGNIQGKNFKLQSNYLLNYGHIGGDDISLQIHKSFINKNKLNGKSAQLLLTSKDGALVNEGEISLNEKSDVELAGVLQNKKEMHFGEINGFIENFLNEGRFTSDNGILTVGTGENWHILDLGALITNGNFFNRFSNENSIMRFGYIAGAGSFINHGFFREKIQVAQE